MRRLAPWNGRTVLDIGCGAGFWLPAYAREADRVVGVEPDPVLRAKAAARVGDLPDVAVLPGSAEHLPLADRSVDVVHARFAYFLDPGGDAGLAEVMRVLVPGGSLVVVDNDYRWGQFAGMLAAASKKPPQLNIEVPATVARAWLARNPAATGLSYGYVLFAVARSRRV